MTNNIKITLRNGFPVFFAVISVLFTLTFGILQLVGAPPFTERNVTIGWVYISISMTVAAFLGMYIGFGLVYLFDKMFGSSDVIQMEELGRRNDIVGGWNINERDISDATSDAHDYAHDYDTHEDAHDNTREDAKEGDISLQKKKKVKFDFNHVLIT